MPRNPLKSFGRRTFSVHNIDLGAKDADTPPVSKPSFRLLDRSEKKREVDALTAESERRPGDQTGVAPARNFRRRSVEELVVDSNRVSGRSMKSNPVSGAHYDSSARHSSASTLPSSVDAGDDVVDGDMLDRKPRAATGSSPNLIPYNSLLPRPPQAHSVHRTDSPPILPRPSYLRETSPPKLSLFLSDGEISPYTEESWFSEGGLLSDRRSSFVPRDDGPLIPAQPSATRTFLGGRTKGYSLLTRGQSSPDFGSPAHSPRNSGTIQSVIADAIPNAHNMQNDRDDRGVKKVELRDPQETTTGSTSFVPTVRSGNASQNPPKPADASLNGKTVVRKPGTTPAREQSTSNSLWEARKKETFDEDEPLSSGLGVEGELYRSFQLNVENNAQHGAALDTRRSGNQRRLTIAQFEELQQSAASSVDQSDEDTSDVEYGDDEDIDKAKRATQQRQKQEAQMAMYRQQMRKVTGGASSNTSSVSITALDHSARSSSAMSLHLGGIDNGPSPGELNRPKQSSDDDGDDDDVPLGILQAHGFPGSACHPSLLADNEAASQRRASVIASNTGVHVAPKSLPPFARNLPADPYYGAGLIQGPQREALGMSNRVSSTFGRATPTPPHMTPMAQTGHPNGLVGIIVGEERARAARRAHSDSRVNSAVPVPYLNDGAQSMASNMGPYTPQAVPMPLMSGAQSMIGTPPASFMSQMNPEQVQQYMSMQMQIMQNMLVMQQQQMGMTTQAAPTQSAPGSPVQQQAIPQIRLSSPTSPDKGRAMSMMNPSRPYSRLSKPQFLASSPSLIRNELKKAPYTPSIAPSERSNIGMPSRYRPVSTNLTDAQRAPSRTSSIPTLLNNGNRSGSDASRQSVAPSPTVRVVDKPKGTPRVSVKAIRRNDDDDDEEAWAEMRKSRKERAHRFKLGLGRRKDGADTASLSSLRVAVD